MGLNLFGNSYSSYDETSKCGFNPPDLFSYEVATGSPTWPLPNPDPKHYEVGRYEEIGNYLVLLVNYPNCVNYEGDKIMVYEDIDYVGLMAQAKRHGLDPHFSGNENLKSPIARFEPTDRGWAMAVAFTHGLRAGGIAEVVAKGMLNEE